MRIMNGRLFKVKGIGACTCMQGAGSLVDYLLCGKNMISYIENFNIEPFRADSDHRPLTFQLKCESIEYAIKGDTEIPPNKSTKFNWCYQDLSEFKLLVNAAISQNKFATFQSCLENKEDVSKVWDTFSGVYMELVHFKFTLKKSHSQVNTSISASPEILGLTKNVRF